MRKYLVRPKEELRRAQALFCTYNEEEWAQLEQICRTHGMGTLSSDDYRAYVRRAQPHLTEVLMVDNFEQMPLYMGHEHPLIRAIAAWRLELGK